MANKKWVADARQLLIDIERIYEDYYSKSYDQCVHDIFNAMRRIVRRNATFRIVEAVHGQWQKTYTCSGERLWAYVCDQCKEENPRASYYCPNCGADMRERNKE